MRGIKPQVCFHKIRNILRISIYEGIAHCSDPTEWGLLGRGEASNHHCREDARAHIVARKKNRGGESGDAKTAHWIFWVEKRSFWKPRGAPLLLQGQLVAAKSADSKWKPNNSRWVHIVAQKKKQRMEKQGCRNGALWFVQLRKLCGKLSPPPPAVGWVHIIV